MMTMSVNPRAPKHTHDQAQRKALKCCVICMNVTAHDAQCPGADTCGATFYHQEARK